MATAESLGSSSNSSPPSFFGRQWRHWLERRKRNRVRNLSRVKFRLTREGVHFVGILSFIFVGAVLRDINLLILLAGSMIGLLLLQWRFNTSTLVGLNVRRRLPRHTTVGRETDVQVAVSNPKVWLGAWLVLAEDRIVRALPDKLRITAPGKALLDAVHPQGTTRGRYKLIFHQRGKYRIGPTTITTRFPLGLGRGWRTIENSSDIFVHPAQGDLTARVTRLFQQDKEGQAQSHATSGNQEGDFFGLRPWATGDSRRWIHWRTTARLGELSVRQFEQQQQRRICILLDLALTDSDHLVEETEQAISFLATLAAETVTKRRDRLAVAIASSQVSSFPAIQSSVLVDTLLDHLAVIQPTEQPNVRQAIRGLGVAILSCPNLLVVSTRPDQTAALLSDESDSLLHRVLGTVRMRWLNVAAGDLEPYFRWTSTK